MLCWLWLMVAHADDSARVETAYAVFVGTKAAHDAGTATVEDVYEWSVRLMEAEAAAGVLSARDAHVVRMNGLAKRVAEQHAAGVAPKLDLDRVRYFQAEAAAWVAEGPGVPKASPVPAPAQAAASKSPPPTPAPPPPSGDIDACFATCDQAFDTCRTDAKHYSLGVGDLSDASETCVFRAEQTCGTGKSAGRQRCREDEIRACEGERRHEQCEGEQTKCNARCR